MRKLLFVFGILVFGAYNISAGEFLEKSRGIYIREFNNDTVALELNPIYIGYVINDRFSLETKFSAYINNDKKYKYYNNYFKGPNGYLNLMVKCNYAIDEKWAIALEYNGINKSENNILGSSYKSIGIKYLF